MATYDFSADGFANAAIGERVTEIDPADYPADFPTWQEPTLPAEYFDNLEWRITVGSGSVATALDGHKAYYDLHNVVAGNPMEGNWNSLPLPAELLAYLAGETGSLDCTVDFVMEDAGALEAEWRKGVAIGLTTLAFYDNDIVAIFNLQDYAGTGRRLVPDWADDLLLDARQSPPKKYRLRAQFEWTDGGLAGTETMTLTDVAEDTVMSTTTGTWNNPALVPYSSIEAISLRSRDFPYTYISGLSITAGEPPPPPDPVPAATVTKLGVEIPYTAAEVARTPKANVTKLGIEVVYSDSTTGDTTGGPVPVSDVDACQFAHIGRQTFFVDGIHPLRRYDHGNELCWSVEPPGTPAVPTVNVRALTDVTLENFNEAGTVPTGWTWGNDDGYGTPTDVEARFPFALSSSFASPLDGSGTRRSIRINTDHVVTLDYAWKALTAEQDWTSYQGLYLNAVSEGREQREGPFLDFGFGPGDTYDPDTAVWIPFELTAVGLWSRGTETRRFVDFTGISTDLLAKVGWIGFRVNSGNDYNGGSPGVANDFVVDIDYLRLKAGIGSTRRYRLVAVNQQGTGPERIDLASPESEASADARGAGGSAFRVYLAPRLWAHGDVVKGERFTPTTSDGYEYVYTESGHTGDTEPASYPTGTTEASDGTAKFQRYGLTYVAPDWWRLYALDDTIEAEYHLVAELPGTTLYYDDDTLDISTLEILQRMRQGPPKTPAAVAAWNGRLALAGSPDDPYAVYISNLDNIIDRYVPGWTTWYRYAPQDANTWEFGFADGQKRDGKDEILALAPLASWDGNDYRGDLLYLGKRSVRVLRGDSANDWNDSWNMPIGCVGRNAWTLMPDGSVCWVSPDLQVYRLDRQLRVTSLADDLSRTLRTYSDVTTVALAYDPTDEFLLLSFKRSSVVPGYTYVRDMSDPERGWVQVTHNESRRTSDVRRIQTTYLAPALTARAVAHYLDVQPHLAVGSEHGMILRMFDRSAAAYSAWSWYGPVVDGRDQYRHRRLRVRGTGSVTITLTDGSSTLATVALDGDGERIVDIRAVSRRWQLRAVGSGTLVYAQLESETMGRGRT